MTRETESLSSLDFLEPNVQLAVGSPHFIPFPKQFILLSMDLCGRYRKPVLGQVRCSLAKSWVVAHAYRSREPIQRRLRKFYYCPSNDMSGLWICARRIPRAD
ncbi:hypothetical protein ACJQWK_08938 [Exserohilum turcicum]